MSKNLKTLAYLPALTSLRAIAAFMVFLHHKNFIPSFDNQFADIFIFQGYTGVSLFFVLSGFLIHRNYIQKIGDLSLNFLKTYFVNRFARVYPMYFLILVVTLLHYNNVNTFFWFLQLSLLKGLSDFYKFTGVATSWSLTVEECFYLFFPFLALARNKKISYFILLAGIYLLGYGLLQIGMHYNYLGFLKPFTFMSLYTFFGRAFEFILGMWASELVLNNKIKVQARAWYTYAGALSVVFTLLILTYIAWTYRKDAHDFQIVAMFYREGFWVHQFLLPIACTVLIIGLSTEKSWLEKVMSYDFFQLLGKSSYVFYLLQGGIFYLYFDSYFPGAENILLFLAMVLVSVLMFLILEDPLNRLIRRKENIFYELKKIFRRKT